MGRLSLDAPAAFAAGRLAGERAAHKPDLVHEAAKALHRIEEDDGFWSR